MYLITNRMLHTNDKKKKGLDVFGKNPNSEGPNELRLVQVTEKKNDTWLVKEVREVTRLLKDLLTY